MKRAICNKRLSFPPPPQKPKRERERVAQRLTDNGTWVRVLANLNNRSLFRAKERAKELAQVLAEDSSDMAVSQAVNKAVVALGGELALSHCGDARNANRVHNCVDDMVMLTDMTESTPQLGRLVVKTITRIIGALEDGHMVETLVPMLERIVKKLHSDEEAREKRED